MFTYVTFSILWCGRLCFIAIDYDHYVILKHCLKIQINVGRCLVIVFVQNKKN